ncbi:MAG: hypothetical protein M0R77_01100 [Gammaproteobacteria bacterium]|nr:hypothetical protein [Gammaproteobacteria bacterium]
MKYYEGENTSSSTTSSNRDSIINAVNQKGDSNAIAEQNSEQSNTGSVVGEQGSLAPSENPGDAESVIDNLIDEEQPGSGSGTEPSVPSTSGSTDSSVGTDIPSEDSGEDNTVGEGGSQSGEETGNSDQVSSGAGGISPPAPEGNEQGSTPEEVGSDSGSNSYEEDHSEEVIVSQDDFEESSSEENSSQSSDQVSGEEGSEDFDTEESGEEDLSENSSEVNAVEEETEQAIEEEVIDAQEVAQDVLAEAGDPSAIEEEESQVEESDTGEDSKVAETSEEILNTKANDNDVDNLTGLHKDAGIIKRAYELDSRIGDYARIILDRFPSDTSTENVDESFLVISSITLETLSDAGKALVGDEFDIEQDNIVQEAIIQSKTNLLQSLDDSIAVLATSIDIGNRTLEKIKNSASQYQSAATEITSPLAQKLVSLLGIQGELDANKLAYSSVTNGVVADVFSWINKDYTVMLKNLETEGVSSVAPLVLNSLPKFNMADDSDILASSELLPGNRVIQQIGNKSNSQAIIDVHNERRDASSVTVPGQSQLESIIAEIGVVTRTATIFSNKLNGFKESLEIFFNWYEKDNTGEVTINGSGNLINAVSFILAFSNYLSNYLRGLSAYALLPVEV